MGRRTHQMLNQFVGVAIAWLMAMVGTLVILKLVDMMIGLRVSEEEECRAWISPSMAKRDIMGNVGVMLADRDR